MSASPVRNTKKPISVESKLFKAVVHVRCDSCKMEQLGHVNAKCWKCPKGHLRFVGGELIKERLLLQQRALTSANHS